MNIWMLIALIAGTIQVAGLLVMIGCALWAPEGYEDADGFHLGNQSLPRSFEAAAPMLGNDDLKHAA